MDIGIEDAYSKPQTTIQTLNKLMKPPIAPAKRTFCLPFAFIYIKTRGGTFTSYGPSELNFSFWTLNSSSGYRYSISMSKYLC